jgi:membrane-bound lytic murein transglycosylase MltF
MAVLCVLEEKCINVKRRQHLERGRRKKCRKLIHVWRSTRKQKIKMKISTGKRNVLRFAVITVLLMIGCPLHESGHTHTESTVDMFHFSGRTVICGIDLGKDIRGGHGLETGFAYQMLQDFAQDHNCNVRIVTGEKGANYLEDLKQGNIDMLMIHHEDVQGDGDIILSSNIIDCSALAVRSEKEGHLREINEWIAQYKASEEYETQKRLFFRTFDPIKRAEKGMMTDIISPYDTLLRQYAAELGWDWRMLAAVVYQESKFSIGARSHRGAMGLMQVMPQTAAYHQVDDLVDPQQNLLAGTRHLKRLQELYSSSDMTNEERIHFILASYNAGAGRIRDCRSLARSRHLDDTKWSNIVKVIPLMNDDSILEDENVRYGKFKGTETIAYVENVMALYDAICTICPR